MSASFTEIDRAVELLTREAPDLYRLLRKFTPRTSYGELTGKPLLGALIDVEGTGLNADEEKVIQVGIVCFEFDDAGNVGRILSTYTALEDPGAPLSPEIVAVTGLTDADLNCKSIDRDLVRAIMDGVQLVIAHNAEYDRKMLERSIPDVFDQLPWACSQRDVTWERFDCRYIGLEFLMMKACGEFFTPHDALDDCRATLHVLACPRSGDASHVSPFQALLESVRQPTIRLWAHNSDYSTKDRLRLRRFRWDANARCWRKDVKPAQLDAERKWLEDNVYYGEDLSGITRISPRDRYSRRAD
jgi:DNA polymerase-3 subunit epsilon